MVFSGDYNFLPWVARSLIGFLLRMRSLSAHVVITGDREEEPRKAMHYAEPFRISMHTEEMKTVINDCAFDDFIHSLS